MRLTAQDLIEMYRRMLRIRYFDDAARKLVEAGTIPGAVHMSTGQEAAVVGACMALRRDDWMSGNHRSHGHPIAKGAAVAPLMAELMGKKTGVCKGRGGSMHLADFAVGSLSESGIVGGGIPLATGAGLSARVRGLDRVAVSFFGDGASNEGVFHESVNMAAVWKLPVIFFCENNFYAATTPMAHSTSVDSIADRAAAYAIPGSVVDGQDAVAVYEAMTEAVHRARRGNGPSLIEARTYRYSEHAEGVGIPSVYRTAEEIERWKERDPIHIHRERLAADEVLSQADAARIEEEIAAEIAAAVAFAQQSELPDPADAFTDLSSIEVCSQREVGTSSAGPERHENHPFAPPSQGGVGEVADNIPVRQCTYFEAVFEALREEMERDERVVLIGEDIELFSITGLLPSPGPNRIWSTPISENGFVGMAIGAAMTGLRPVVDLTISSFVYLAADQLVNQAAKIRYMSGGQARVPAVFRSTMWYGGSNAAQHSDRPYPLFMNAPGLKIALPASPADLKGLLKSAIRDDDPVLVFEDKNLWFRSGPVPKGDYIVPLGVANVVRAGRDVTIVSIGATVWPALEAAEELQRDGISVEVIDPRTLVPLDRNTILASVARTGRLVVVDLACKTAGAAAEIAAIIAEEAFGCLKAPVLRVATPDVQIPFSPTMEMPLYPNKEKIVAAVRRSMA
jgi:2-oxoisovalerate dehydrogenase E1 component